MIPNTKEFTRVADYLASFGIAIEKINLRTITRSGYDALIPNGDEYILVFRPWPVSLDVNYLISIVMSAINSLGESE